MAIVFELCVRNIPHQVFAYMFYKSLSRKKPNYKALGAQLEVDGGHQEMQPRLFFYC